MFLPDRKTGIIPPLRSVVLRLLTPFPFRSLGVVLRIIQVIGAIFQRRSFGASAEEIGLELPFFPFELFDFCSNAAMRFRESRWRLCQYPTCWRNSRFSRCKRSTSAQLDYFPVRVLDWVNQLRGGAARTTDLYQLVDHDHLGLPKRPRFGKRRVPFYPLQTDLYGRDRRSFTIFVILLLSREGDARMDARPKTRQVNRERRTPPPPAPRGPNRLSLP